MSKPKIITVGAAVQDVFLSNSSELVPVCENPETCFMKLGLGEKVDVNNINFSTGGGATNAAVTFARQGFDVSFMGTIGEDPAGQAVMNELDKEGIDTSHVSVSPKYNTGYSVLLLAPNGERTILTYRGASTHYDVNHFDINGSRADWMYVSSMAGKMHIIDKLFTQARQNNIKIFLNPGKKELAQKNKLKSLLSDVEVLLVNKEEAQSIVSGETIQELCTKLLNLVPVVIISDGANGVCSSDGKSFVKAGIYEEVDALDRTGAGDAFGSGFLSQFSQGKTIRESVHFASANSTSVVLKIGAKDGILHENYSLHDMDITEEIWQKK